LESSRKIIFLIKLARPFPNHLTFLELIKILLEKIICKN